MQGSDLCLDEASGTLNSAIGDAIQSGSDCNWNGIFRAITQNLALSATGVLLTNDHVGNNWQTFCLNQLESLSDNGLGKIYNRDDVTTMARSLAKLALKSVRAQATIAAHAPTPSILRLREE